MAWVLFNSRRKAEANEDLNAFLYDLLMLSIKNNNSIDS